MSTHSTFITRIDNNLSMYRSQRSDAERLGQFYSIVFKNDDGTPDESVFPYVEDLLNGRHPTFHEDDYVYIQDETTGKIVSAMCLISQTWTYGGIPVPAGRPEAVGTDEAYRNRGLVRALFTEVHRRSKQRGELILGITGIPYYYRLFGYEMCVELEGGWKGTRDTLPKLTDKQKEAYRIREVEERDLSALTSLYEQSCNRLLMASPRSEVIWRNDIFVRSQKSDDYRKVWMIENPQDEALGFFINPTDLGPEYADPTSLSCYWYTLKPGVSYLDVTPVVLQHLLKIGQEYASAKEKTCTGVGLYLDTGHPAYQVIGKSLPVAISEYTWYMRIPDLPAFLQKITPVLEKRLENSCCSGHTGEITITLYRIKLILGFTNGKLIKIEQIPFTGDKDCQASFPGWTFLQLLLGYRTVEEIKHIYPDCIVDYPSQVLLKALFPKSPSNIWPL